MTEKKNVRKIETKRKNNKNQPKWKKVGWSN